MRRDLVWADIEAAYQFVGECAVSFINTGHEHPPYVLVMRMDPARCGQVKHVVPLSTALVREGFSSPEMKAVMGTQIRSIMRPGPLRADLERRDLEPDFVAVISEAWIITRRIDADYEVPSEAADRQDCLLVAIHTSTLTHCMQSVIHTVNGKRSVKLAPLSRLVSSEGRMTMTPSTEVPPGATEDGRHLVSGIPPDGWKKPT